MPTRRSIRGAALAVAAALASPAAAELTPARELVRTGARIPGLGRVGQFWATPLAIDDSGRVVAIAILSDGSATVVRSAGGQPEVVWRQTAAGGDDPVAGFAVSSPDGQRIVTLGQFVPAGNFYAAQRVFDLTDDARLVLAAGDRTLDGSVIHGVTLLGTVSNSGALLMEALVASGDVPVPAIVLHAADGVRLVASTDAQAPEAVRFASASPAGVRADGTAIVSGCRDAEQAECGIYATDGTTVEPVLTTGDLGAGGSVIDGAYAVDVAANREMLLRTYTDGVYEYARTAGGDLLPVASQLTLGDVPFSGDVGRLNARGDVVWSGRVGTDSASNPLRTDFAVVLLPGDGPPRRLPLPADGARLNDRGEVAAAVHSPGSQPELVRWSGGDPITVLSTRSATADGAGIFAAGVGGACLADDGRVAFLADTVGGASGWMCDDGHAQSLLGSVLNRRRYSFGTRCAFAGVELVGVTSEGVVRFDGRRATPVISAEDVLPDGTAIQFISDLAANDRGTVVVTALSGLHLLRQRAGERVEAVDLRIDGSPVTYVQNMGLADDDTIVAVVSQESVPALVVHRDDATTVLDTTDTLGAGHYSNGLLVNGMWAVLASTDPADRTPYLTLFDLSTGVGRPILPPAERPDPALRLYPSYLTPGGELLLAAYGTDPSAAAVEYWIWRDGVVEVLRDGDGLRDGGRPFALADSGALLLDTSAGVNGVLSGLSLTGPAATARCPGTAAAAASNDGDGCQVGPAERITLWPLLLGALLWSAARRHRRATCRRRRRPPHVQGSGRVRISALPTPSDRS